MTERWGAYEDRAHLWERYDAHSVRSLCGGVTAVTRAVDFVGSRTPGTLSLCAVCATKEVK